ncbi:hypothetical protein [Pseudoduganella namucuonensis]|uniref:DUF4410 domain-containing protein n=1 Tax=Pseudoduganella namucuonensis TaxID=1035707 RepID=A0A1I7IXK2_9BURK|nr:hypothetical protein [Pseudoduganella namucuonensis]SFU77656.1 hypothetical protein SAMN05216552_1009136 [Pseudoduganella namucuonensis]
MTKSLKAALLCSAMLSLALLQGCATSIKASSTVNPAPSAAFKTFSRIEVKPAVFKEGYKGNASGLAKINDNIQKDLKTKLAEWNSRPSNGRTLVIEPVVEELSFKRGAKRVLLGPLAGSSGVLLRLNIRDQQGRVVAAPEFFQHADAMAAGFIFGVHDNLMLTRVASLASGYVIANYEHAQGGPTGATEQNVAL